MNYISHGKLLRNIKETLFFKSSLREPETTAYGTNPIKINFP